ncbi:MAG: GAF domain-containing protein [Chloroflexota bacterium]
MQPSATSSIISLLYSPRYRYTDAFDQMRARVTLIYALFSVVGSLLVIISALVTPLVPMFSTGTLLSAAVVGILPGIAIMALVHLGHLRFATFITYAMLMLSALGALNSGVASNLVIVLSLSMLYASLIWQWRGTIITAILQGLMILTAAALQIQGIVVPSRLIPVDQIPLQTLLDLVFIVAIGIMSGASSEELRRALRYTTRLVAQLRATSEVAQRTSSLIKLNELLQQTVNYILDRFGFYHVQIFLIDAEQRFATLEASTSETGKMLSQRGYRLAVGSQGVIGQVTLLGEPMTLDTEYDETVMTRRDELLPETRSELALPLIARDRIIGVLDIQSTRPNAFHQEDVESLGIMASLISIAISNAKLFQEQQTALNENRRLFLDAETNLREIQLLNQRLTGEAWEDYLRSRSTEVIGYTLNNNQLRHDETWTPALSEATQKRQPVITTDGDRQIIAVPVELRGRAIGAIEVETDSAVRQSDTLEMLQSVAQRLALSIDNARLFEQAQELAQQELEVNAISAKLQGITSMSELIKTAMSELSRALGAEQAAIRLGLALRNAPNTPVNTNGSNGKGPHA